MKPRIWKWLGVYHCGLPIQRGIASYETGLGYTPTDAYDDWLLRALETPHPPWCSGGCCNPREAT